MDYYNAILYNRLNVNFIADIYFEWNDISMNKEGIVSDKGDGTFNNPLIFADVPDEDIIRVGDTYYMISTTMHLSTGAPIMKSYDLVNREIVNYVYDYLETDDARSLKNGRSDYAYGQWAASLRYDKYQKRFYVTFSSQTIPKSYPKSYFFVTEDIENEI